MIICVYKVYILYTCAFILFYVFSLSHLIFLLACLLLLMMMVLLAFVLLLFFLRDEMMLLLHSTNTHTLSFCFYY